MSSSGQVASKLPESDWVGRSLDGKADWTEIVLAVELPFWVMVPNCEIEVDVRGHRYGVAILDDVAELLSSVADDSLVGCIYFGPVEVPPDVIAELQKNRQAATRRKCKTVIQITTRCNSDAVAALNDGGRRERDARWYLRTLCDAHIQVVNTLVQQYRLATYDHFAYELAPWDVPIWFALLEDQQLHRISLLDYADMDWKPAIFGAKAIGNPDAKGIPFQHIEPSALQEAMCQEPSGGEYELLDAANFMIRGDYSDAVRRITTAIEALLESALRAELLKHYQPTDVEQRLRKSQNNFSGRLKQYEKLAGREMIEALRVDLFRTRSLRHEIVHRGRRLSFHESGIAQRAVDTGRWIYNWLENNTDRRNVRETKIAFRSIGKHVHIMNSSLTADGAVVSVVLWPDPPHHDDIAIAAFFMWENGGRQDGRELHYWLAAEKEVWAEHWRSHEAGAQRSQSAARRKNVAI